MDRTLNEYLTLADSIHDHIEKFGIALATDKLEENVNELQTGIKNIQAVAKRMADISNIINQIVLHRKKTITYIDPYPTEYDHAVLRMKYPKESKEIVRDVNIPIVNVDTEKEIPVSNLYYIGELDQYAINIAGLIIKGNLANIMNYQAEKTARCEYGIKCKSIQSCKYYHEPEDYIKLGMAIPENNTRAFTVGSWIFNRNKKPKTYYTRHIGSRDTLSADLKTLKKIQYRDEVSNREGQLIHDLLIYLILHNQGLLEKYKHWI
jgi:hypothetical protein